MDAPLERQHALASAARGDDAALFALAERLQSEWRLDEAESLLRAALPSPIDPARAHFQLSILLMQQGFAAEAFEQVAAALRHAPKNRVIRDHALTLEKLRCPPSPARFLNQHRLFGALFASNEVDAHLRVARSLDPERALRVAYLTPDAHLATWSFTETLMSLHDRRRIQPAFYYAFPCDLVMMQERFPGARHVSLVGAGADQVVATLLGDRVDIAIDLSGHGAGNMLSALQQRPAPVQITWLDYVATTGVPGIDWRIGDAVTDPPESDKWSTELPLRLGVPPWCYAPSASAPPARPASVGTELVIGVPCVPLKLSDGMLALLSRVLQALPQTRLLIPGLPEGRSQARVRSALTGIDPQRIELQPRLGLDAWYRAIDRMDIVVDPIAFSGATATLDCLWQGIPVVSMPGVLPHTRSTASILSHLGFGSWIASDESKLVEIVCELARDYPERARVRESLRDRLSNSALVDGKRFIAALESSLREAWSCYVHCRNQASEHTCSDNHAAERRGTKALHAIASGSTESREVVKDLDETLSQMPQWIEVRERYWRAVREIALAEAIRRREAGAPPMSSMQNDVTAGERVIAMLVTDGERSGSRDSVPWLRDVPLFRIASRQPLLDCYRKIADASNDGDWLLVGDAQARSLWSGWPEGLDSAMAHADVLGALGEVDPPAPQLRGTRIVERDGALFGRVWGPARNRVPCSALCSPWLLIRRDSLRTALSAVATRSTAADESLGFAGWHRMLTRALAAGGARLGITTALQSIEAESAADSDIAERRLFEGIAEQEAPDRRRIDVGKGFKAAHAADARLLIEALFDSFE